MESALFVVRLVLAATFMVAAIAKLADPQGSENAISSFGLPGTLARPLRLALPLAELTVGLLLLLNFSAWIGGLLAFALLLTFTTAIAVSLARGRRPDCHCFGQLHSAPVGRSTLVRNALLLAGAGLIVWQGRESPGLNALEWTNRLSWSETVGLISAAVLLFVLAVEGWIILRLFRQHGRLLLRLDQIESRLAADGAEGLSAASPESGLPIGSAAPSFELPLLSGDRISLEQLLQARKPVVLLFSDPNCVPCDMLLPQLEHWQHDHADKITIALVTRGSVEENRKKLAGHELSNVMLQKDREVAEAYGSPGTPSAVLVRADGSIGSYLVIGPEAVASLAAHATTAIHNGHDRNGHATHHTLKIGEPAPELRLPDLSGRLVELSDFAGRDTLVLFWNPACRFCDQMLPALKAWEENKKPGDPELLVVSAGSAEVNDAMRLRATVCLDNRFHTGNAFGAQGTPSAVLIDGQGRIVSEPVMGASEVLALVSRTRHVEVSRS